MPIVFIHEGYSPYLEFTLRQARAAAPEAEIVLLGDEENDRFPFVTHVDIGAREYQDAGGEAEQVYQHMATNPYPTVLRWLQRWFWLRTFLRDRSEVTDVWVLDSDVMLYAGLDELAQAFASEVDLALSVPGVQEPFVWSASPHVSYWSREAVEDFCTFALASYTEPQLLQKYQGKWTHHMETGTPGGVCDMTTLYLFALGRSHDNVSRVREGVAVDHNINGAANEHPDEYAMRRGLKAITWDEEQRPSGENLNLGASVRFLALHLQGPAKGFCGVYYRGPEFQGQQALARRLRRYFAARTVAGKLKAVAWRGLSGLRRLASGARGRSETQATGGGS